VLKLLLSACLNVCFYRYTRRTPDKHAPRRLSGTSNDKKCSSTASVRVSHSVKAMSTGSYSPKFCRVSQSVKDCQVLARKHSAIRCSTRHIPAYPTSAEFKTQQRFVEFRRARTRQYIVPRVSPLHVVCIPSSNSENIRATWHRR
jgi:hypothetical protein